MPDGSNGLGYFKISGCRNGAVSGYVQPFFEPMALRKRFGTRITGPPFNGSIMLIQSESRSVFGVSEKSHIKHMKEINQSVLDGTSKWSAKIAITGLLAATEKKNSPAYQSRPRILQLLIFTQHKQIRYIIARLTNLNTPRDIHKHTDYNITLSGCNPLWKP